MNKLIEIGHWSTAEVCEVDGKTTLIITNESLRCITITLEEARALYKALRQFDSEGLLDD